MSQCDVIEPVSEDKAGRIDDGKRGGPCLVLYLKHYAKWETSATFSKWAQPMLPSIEVTLNIRSAAARSAPLTGAIWHSLICRSTLRTSICRLVSSDPSSQ